MYTWVYKHITPARREVDPKNKYRKAHVGVQMQNTCKKGVRPKKTSIEMHTWVYKCKTPARRELDPKNKYRNAHVGVQMQNTCKKGVRPKKQTKGCARACTNTRYLQEGS